MSSSQQARHEELIDSPAFLQLIQTQHMIAAGQEEIAEAIRVGPVDVAVADLRRRYTEVADFIQPGARRAVLGTTGFGATVALAAGVATPLLSLNPRRLGGRIVNAGPTANVALFLCELGDQAAGATVPQITMPVGAAWDLLLGNALWCGNVCAVAGAGGATVTVAEV